MSDYKNIIDQETKNFIGYVQELINLELNFRKYMSNGLSEDNYKLAASEYSSAIKPIKEKVMNVEKQLEEMTEDTEVVSEEMLSELNRGIGKIWRIIVMNETFATDYGSVSFTDEPVENLYKEIYDNHLKELQEFMYYFIKVANILFSK